MKEFYVQLISTSSTTEFPSNRANSFKNRLPYQIQLKQEGWKVGLSSISYPVPPLRRYQPSTHRPYLFEDDDTLLEFDWSIETFQRSSNGIWFPAVYRNGFYIKGADLHKDQVKVTSGKSLMRYLVNRFQDRLTQYMERANESLRAPDGKKYYRVFRWEGDSLIIDNTDTFLDQKGNRMRPKACNMATKALLGKSLWRTFLFAAYSMLGSWLFCYVERTPITYKEMSANMLDELRQKYNITMNHSDFIAFANDPYKAIKVGRKVEWTFLNTTSYVFTILTTIGYGHMTPDTWLGQLLTVFYDLAGLPISMLALKTLGEVIVSGAQSFVVRIEKRLLKVRDVRRIRQKTFLATCALMILFLLLGSVINLVAEGWSFVEGLYTWFVVLSTIGFEDYIPFQSLDQ
ncbi:uncharacterized protein LOC110042100 [Orbicella faveolata]|uniref:uncharacterized protein LOC110042100 n=1 Tax=Orbicella faveolata TaxID=48498 RepID=UPI0009E3852F|nr:uncharacterized protein LOC110042100 [Orbicella faveolata]